MKLTQDQLIEWFFTACPDFPAEFRAQWLATLASPPAGTTRAQLISGTKQGINDTLSTVRYWPEERRKRIDEALAAKGLPSIYKMMAGLKKKHERILARGKVRNDEEYYIVTEILSDMDFEISDSDRTRLRDISGEYESSKVS